MVKYILTMLCLMCSWSGVMGQGVNIGVGVGGSLYWGDLNSKDFGQNIGNTNLALQVVGNYEMSDYLSIRGIGSDYEIWTLARCYLKHQC